MAPATLLAGKRILLVEDEYLIASDLARLLERLGAQVVGPASRLSTGLDLADREALDAAALDINLDNEMTYPIARRLAERAAPYVFITGYDELALPFEFRAQPRLTKPFAAARLIDALENVLASGPAG